MPAVQRLGDANDAGGVITAAANSVRVNNRPIALFGNPVSPHPCCGEKGCPPSHCSATLDVGLDNVRAENIKIIVTGHADTCGDLRAGGSENVRAGTSV